MKNVVGLSCLRRERRHPLAQHHEQARHERSVGPALLVLHRGSEVVPEDTLGAEALDLLSLQDVAERQVAELDVVGELEPAVRPEIGRASCRERV